MRKTARTGVVEKLIVPEDPTPTRATSPCCSSFSAYSKSDAAAEFGLRLRIPGLAVGIGPFPRHSASGRLFWTNTQFLLSSSRVLSLFIPQIRWFGHLPSIFATDLALAGNSAFYISIEIYRCLRRADADNQRVSHWQVKSLKSRPRLPPTGCGVNGHVSPTRQVRGGSFPYVAMYRSFMTLLGSNQPVRITGSRLYSFIFISRCKIDATSEVSY